MPDLRYGYLLSRTIWAPGHNAPLIRFFLFQHYIYCLLIYITCFPAYHFSSLFLTYLLTYLSFPLRIDLHHFQAGCRKKRLNLALDFFVFILFSSTLLLIGECMLLCVKFSFSMPSQEIGSGKRLQNDLFCVKWDIKPHTTQSITQTHQSQAITVPQSISD